LRQKKNNISFPQNIILNYQRLFCRLAGYGNYRDRGLMFVDYRDLSVEQSEIVWEIRNRDEIRCWMDNPEPFSLEAHFSFIDNLKISINKLYWAIFQNNDIVGSINIEFDESGEEIERGVFISPDYMGQSFGNLIEEASVTFFKKMGIKKIRARVIKENIKSINFHLKNSYIEIDKDDKSIYYIKELNE
jgi:RimJ/RimL family protein N-acetyltransferase